MPTTLWRIMPQEPLERPIDEAVYFWNEWAQKQNIPVLFYLRGSQVMAQVEATTENTPKFIGLILAYCPDIGSIARLQEAD